MLPTPPDPVTFTREYGAETHVPDPRAKAKEKLKEMKETWIKQHDKEFWQPFVATLEWEARMAWRAKMALWILCLPVIIPVGIVVVAYGMIRGRK